VRHIKQQLSKAHCHVPRASPGRSPLLMPAPGAHRGLRRTPLAHPSRLMLGTTTSAGDLACWCWGRGLRVSVRYNSVWPQRAWVTAWACVRVLGVWCFSELGARSGFGAGTTSLKTRSERLNAQTQRPKPVRYCRCECTRASVRSELQSRVCTDWHCRSKLFPSASSSR
jgi:hypothetical protein